MGFFLLVAIATWVYFYLIEDDGRIVSQIDEVGGREDSSTHLVRKLKTVVISLGQAQQVQINSC